MRFLTQKLAVAAALFISTSTFAEDCADHFSQSKQKQFTSDSAANFKLVDGVILPLHTMGSVRVLGLRCFGPNRQNRFILVTSNSMNEIYEQLRIASESNAALSESIQRVYRLTPDEWNRLVELKAIH